MKLVPGMGVRIVQIGAGRGMGIPVIGGTELRSTTAGDQVLPVANFIAMHPIVSQRRNGFLFSADFAGLRSFLRTGWSGLLPGMIPCCRDIPGFGKAASRTDSGLPSVCAAPINSWIDELAELPKQEFYATLSRRIDSELHKHYRLYPCNYIAIDELEGTQTHADHYTQADKKRFEEYLASQLAKIKLPDKDDAFLRECILTMYANPLRNYLKVKNE